MRVYASFTFFEPAGHAIQVAKVGKWHGMSLRQGSGIDP